MREDDDRFLLGRPGLSGLSDDLDGELLPLMSIASFGRLILLNLDSLLHLFFDLLSSCGWLVARVDQLAGRSPARLGRVLLVNLGDLLRGPILLCGCRLLQG